MKKLRLLLQQAKQSLKNAYSPYSNYQVGAAVLTESGKIFTGSNIENASYGLTICAERVAIFKAISEGHRKFKAIAVVSKDANYPCGACLQVMAEFAPNLTIILSDTKNKPMVKKLENLLPNIFKLKC